MATNAYQKNYKRKWISACRLITKYNNHTSRLSTTQCEQPTKISKLSVQPEHGFLFNHFGDDVNPNFDFGHSDDPEYDGHCTPSVSESESSEDDISDNESIGQCFPDQLAAWIDQFQVKQNAVDGLLTILRQSGHPDLPATARSLLKTSRVINIDKKSGMDYFYFPFEDTLLKNFY